VTDGGDANGLVAKPATALGDPAPADRGPWRIAWRRQSGQPSPGGQPVERLQGRQRPAVGAV